jgi:bifunctional DNA-binding transcriptional regulator/antitoxin component of YhaV-PrlF toxin-antitoxin module
MCLVAKSKKNTATKSYARPARPAPRSATVKKAPAERAFVIHMNSQGRLTLPASARRRLGLEGEVDFQLALESHAFVLKPAVVLTLEDAWAYTAEHRELLARAHDDSRRGRVHRFTEGQLDGVMAAR